MASRGFYNFRPFAAPEVPLRANFLVALPINLYVGGEYALYLGRLLPLAVAVAAWGRGDFGWRRWRRWRSRIILSCAFIH